MKSLKKPLTFEEQVEKLISHGMVADNNEDVLAVLKEKNYYRFTGYALQDRVSPHDSTYVLGTSFEHIYRLYLFDQSMRDILRKFIEICEIYYRTQISYGFSIKKCLLEPHDQHYDESNFYNKKAIKKLSTTFTMIRNIIKIVLLCSITKKNTIIVFPFGLWSKCFLFQIYQNYIALCISRSKIISLH